jgi:hypothetical protein
MLSEAIARVCCPEMAEAERSDSKACVPEKNAQTARLWVVFPTKTSKIPENGTTLQSSLANCTPSVSRFCV